LNRFLDVADRIVVMNEGCIEQMGTPEEVYENPASPFVYDFLGNVNLFHGRVHKGKLNVGSVELEAPEHKHVSNVDGIAYVRPHDLSISRTKQSIDAIPAKVSYFHAVGPVVYVELKRDGTDEYLEAEISKEQFKHLSIQAGDVVYVQPKEVKVFIPEDFVI
ncbi:TOBE-like domain-containing protein, partial [Bacillus thuringiensis]|nr:TOBE-like domain-containing protein [Bacillus thuringiensis]